MKDLKELYGERVREVIYVTNHKGGVAKTTTTVNLAVGLSEKPYKKRVLVIDLDSQCNASTLLGWNRELENAGCVTLFNSITMQMPLYAYYSNYENVWLIPGSTKMKNIDPFLQSRLNKEEVLQSMMQEPIKLVDLTKKDSIVEARIGDYFDYVLIDRPRDQGEINFNALVAASSVLVPTQLERLSIEGMNETLLECNAIRKKLNPELEVRGILRVMVNKQLKLSKEMNRALEREMGEVLLKTSIPKSVSISNSQNEEECILQYDPKSSGAEAYAKLLDELFGAKKLRR